MSNVTVAHRYARIAPRKARAIANLVRGKNVAWAQDMLPTVPKKGARIVFKLLRAGIAAAKAKKLVDEKLSIKSAIVQEGPRLKRSRSHFRGVVRPIDKQMSHITLILSDEEQKSHGPKAEKRSRLPARRSPPEGRHGQ